MIEEIEVICNLVNMAKHDEKKAIKFYKELLDKVPPENKNLAETIEEIMKDEEDHYKKLVGILYACIGIEPSEILDTHARPGHIYLK